MRLQTLSTTIILAVAAQASAITFNDPITVATGLNGVTAEVVAATERYGSNKGRLHIAYVGPASDGGTGIYYTRETGVGTSVFTAPVRISTLGTTASPRQNRQVDIATDLVGAPYVCWQETVGVVQTIRFAAPGQSSSVFGAGSINHTTVSRPKIVAATLQNESRTIPIIIYFGDDLGVGSDLEVYASIGSSAGLGVMNEAFNVTNDTLSSYANPSFDMVPSFPPSSGSTAYNYQGAIVFEQNSQLFAISVTAATVASTLAFGPSTSLLDSVQAQQPAVIAQTASFNDVVLHVTYRTQNLGAPAIGYTQALTEDGGFSYLTESRSDIIAPLSFGYPSVAVVPDTSLGTRFVKPTAVTFVDNGAFQLRGARNTGGLSDTFGFQAAEGGTPRPITGFNDTGAKSLNGQTLLADGPKTAVVTGFGGNDLLRVVGQSGNNIVVFNEFGLPNPTPTPTATATNTPSATPTVTTSPSLSPTRTPTISPTNTNTPSATSTATGSASPTSTPVTTQSPSPTNVPTTRPPTATPIPTPSPIITPTTTATFIPTVTATPDTVGTVEIVDTLNGLRPNPTEERFEQGDYNQDEVWDCADIVRRQQL